MPTQTIDNEYVFKTLAEKEVISSEVVEDFMRQLEKMAHGRVGFHLEILRTGYSLELVSISDRHTYSRILSAEPSAMVPATAVVRHVFEATVALCLRLYGPSFKKLKSDTLQGIIDAVPFTV